MFLFNLPRNLLLKSIKLYQYRVSPHKGYACSHRVLHGGSGCSGVGYRLVRRYGATKGLILLRQRFKNCHQAYHEINNNPLYTHLKALHSSSCEEERTPPRYIPPPATPENNGIFFVIGVILLMFITPTCHYGPVCCPILLHSDCK